METKPHSRRGPKIQAIVLTMALLAVAGYVGYTANFKKKMDDKRTPSPELIVFKNLPDNVAIEAFLQSKKHIEPLAVDHQSLILTTEQRNNFSLPYSVNAKLTYGDGNYYDLSWRVDERGVRYFVTLDGFRPSDTLTFNFKGTDTLKNIPFDWSGRLTLEAFLIKAETIDACVDVKGQMAFSVCHTVTGNPEASV